MLKKFTLAVLLLGAFSGSAVAADELADGFRSPPDANRPSCFWWWFNSLVDKAGITRDLEEFKAKGMGGVMLICSGNDYGVAPMPRGPVFLSPDWRELYRHAVQECARLGLELGVNFCGGGWCMGGSWIRPEHSSRWYVQSHVVVEGPRRFSERLPLPGHRDGYELPYHGNVGHYITWPKEKADYRDTAVVAFREADGGVSDLGPERRKHLPAKSNRWDGGFNTSSATLQKATLSVWSAMPGDRPIGPGEVIDLTATLKPDGSLDWDVPAGRWTIQRLGHVVIGCDVRCVLPEVGYVLEVDWLNPEAVDEMFIHLGRVLLEDAGPHVGKTLKFLHTDSFEDGFPNWTGRLLDKFQQYRGYDPKPYLPVLAGKIVGSAEIADRFLYDYRKTVADCLADGNYGHFAARCAAHGLESQCEAGGPAWSGTVCMDALKNLGRCDRPMGEFWTGGLNVSKQTAIASHIYGRRTASAEAFTGFAHWREAPSHLKPIADQAFCDGINRFLFHTATCQRAQDGKPGYEYGAGTHFNPNVTWWQQAAGPWLSYVSRCQAMLQSGLFVADVLYYYGDWAPNRVDPVRDPSLKGYDYDVCNAEVLLTRLSVKEGRILLPDGMSYRLLVDAPRIF
ncbi:MAG: glycosyl hydrolase [Planctomycetota bacterium]|nr:glycosyl hydrolase [Planctomycetota bacterium]